MSNAFIYIINVAMITSLIYAGWRKYRVSNSRNHFFPALLLKLICGGLMGWLYFEYYGSGDTIQYYEQAVSLADQQGLLFLKTIVEGILPDQPVRALYFVRFTALLIKLTQADYWLLATYLSVFSFLGSFYFCEKVTLWQGKMAWPALLSVLYFPSVVFWSSGLLKESLAWGSLTFLLGVYFSWLRNQHLSIRQMILVLIASIVLILFKYYIAALVFPGILYLVLVHRLPWGSLGVSQFWSKALWLILFLAIPVLCFHYWLSPNLTWGHLWHVMQQNHVAYLQLSPRNRVETLQLFGNWFDVMINVGYFWFSGLFRPFIGETMTFPAVLSTVENTILWMGAMTSIFHLIRSRVKWTPEGLAALVYVNVLSLLLSYAAPNLGTLARYKIYYVPFLCMLVIHQLMVWRTATKREKQYPSA